MMTIILVIIESKVDTILSTKKMLNKHFQCWVPPLKCWNSFYCLCLCFCCTLTSCLLAPPLWPLSPQVCAPALHLFAFWALPIILFISNPPVLCLFRSLTRVHLRSDFDGAVAPRLKVACRYRCGHQSDKGHKLKPKCLQACPACVSVPVCRVSSSLSPEPTRQERRFVLAVG